MKTLEALVSTLAEDRMVVVARELTKIYEQVVLGTAQEIHDYFASHEDKVRGEFVVVVGV
jgi:16S rRNA (cytidine1402-2'-O)-methyltransferase